MATSLGGAREEVEAPNALMGSIGTPIARGRDFVGCAGDRGSSRSRVRGRICVRAYREMRTAGKKWQEVCNRAERHTVARGGERVIEENVGLR